MKNLAFLSKVSMWSILFSLQGELSPVYFKNTGIRARYQAEPDVTTQKRAYTDGRGTYGTQVFSNCECPCPDSSLAFSLFAPGGNM